ncbi:histidine kinase [Winogradskyella maritima]|uniref:histidine kinase n=1 Tax=Winogradskyella maritima TaxID=1517766 RepID=A0ABV8AI93_9FLAO|nr:histidine kinase [Winogradskyella maritima]
MMLSLFFLLFQNKPVTTEAERYLLVYFILVIGIVFGLFILFFVVFQKRKNKLLREKFEQQRRFDEAISTAQQEIQDETLKSVGRDLHDNVGQLLALANMQMNSVLKNADEAIKPKVENASKALKDSLSEVRALSKSLNSDVIFNQGFAKSIANELQRIERSGRLSTEFHIEGERIHFENKKDEVILFRILQEFFSNTIKYAEAEKLSVDLTYAQDAIKIEVSDNGKGFNIADIEQGAGLINMKERAKLIGADYELNSRLNMGTTLKINFPLNVIIGNRAT